MQYRLRTLLIVFAILPPLFAYGYSNWRAERDRQAAIKAIDKERAEASAELVRLMQTAPGPPWSKDDQEQMELAGNRFMELTRAKATLNHGKFSN